MRIRWRLVIALVSLALTVALTALPAASRAFGQPISDIWPNRLPAVTQEIWPNGTLTSDIWPNGLSLDSRSGGGLTTTG